MPEQLIRQAVARGINGEKRSDQIATSVCEVSSLIHAELALVVGNQAASALCTHAVHRTRSSVGWRMPAAAGVNLITSDALRADLSARAPDEALSAGLTLLFALVDHLTSLIGLPITLRILRAALSPADTASPSQENLQ